MNNLYAFIYHPETPSGDRERLHRHCLHTKLYTIVQNMKSVK
jgi:hypothetical protein